MAMAALQRQQMSLFFIRSGRICFCIILSSVVLFSVFSKLARDRLFFFRRADPPGVNRCFTPKHGSVLCKNAKTAGALRIHSAEHKQLP
jgi:hypothetical protein